MKLVHLNASDLSGGAARATYRLHKTYLSHGLLSDLIVQEKLTDEPTVQTIYHTQVQNVISKLLPYIDRSILKCYRKRQKNAVWHPGLMNFWPLSKHPAILNADVIILYWVCNGFIGIKTVGKLLTLNKPVVWRLSDMWPFTGGCHYAAACKRYENICGCCPQLGSKSEKDLSNIIYNYKRKWWKKNNTNQLTIVSPSRWLASKAQKSLLFKDFSSVVIPTGVDTNIFKPINREQSRKILNLPQQKLLILLGADKYFKADRKGFGLINESLNILLNKQSNSNDTPEVVIFGSNQKLTDLNPSLKLHALGKFSNDFILPIIYSACDVFVCPSIEDNLPNTVIESMACGTPAVSFRVGGLPEIIDHELNGFLAEAFDLNDLAVGIQYVLDNFQDNRSLSKNARRKALNKFDIKNNIHSYLRLYKKLLQHK